MKISRSAASIRFFSHMSAEYAHIHILLPGIRTGTGPKPSISPGPWPSGPSPGTRPRGIGPKDQQKTSQKTTSESMNENSKVKKRIQTTVMSK